MFQPYTNGYLITTVETVMMTGKRTPPIWLIILTALSTLVVLVGGILLLLFYHASTEPHKLDTFFGTLALLVMILFPTMIVIRYYLKLENPITIRREDLLALERDAAHLSMTGKVTIRKRPIRFILGTRSEEEAMTIERNLSVHANGRLRVYPITFLPEKQWLLTKLAQTEIHLVAPEKGR